MDLNVFAAGKVHNFQEDVRRWSIFPLRPVGKILDPHVEDRGELLIATEVLD